MNKNQQRVDVKKKLTSMTKETLKKESAAILRCLQSMASIESATTIMSFLPLWREVDLRPIMQVWIEEGKTLCVPIVHWETHSMQAGLLTSLEPKGLVETRHGIIEPKNWHVVPADSIDVVLVPGLAFDADGGRLGRGGGFYDRFLSLIRPPLAIGIGFTCQLLEHVALEEHDHHVTAIATPSGLVTS